MVEIEGQTSETKPETKTKPEPPKDEKEPSVLWKERVDDYLKNFKGKRIKTFCEAKGYPEDEFRKWHKRFTRKEVKVKKGLEIEKDLIKSSPVETKLVETKLEKEKKPARSVNIGKRSLTSILAGVLILLGASVSFWGFWRIRKTKPKEEPKREQGESRGLIV